MEATNSGTVCTLSLNSNGLLCFNSTRKSFGRYVHIKFVNRVFDFILPKDIFLIPIDHFEPFKSKLFKDLKFGWSYTNNLKSLFYKPNEVFLDFHTWENDCYCHKSKYANFCQDIPPLGHHVLTTDLNVCFHKDIKHFLNKGLNHISHKLINSFDAFHALWDGWDIVCSLLNIKVLVDHKSKLDAVFFSRFDRPFPNYVHNP